MVGLWDFFFVMQCCNNLALRNSNLEIILSGSLLVKSVEEMKM